MERIFEGFHGGIGIRDQWIESIVRGDFQTHATCGEEAELGDEVFEGMGAAAAWVYEQAGE
jgi:hypothetical protein